ncbi:ORF6C domain-containing protein [Clostridium botulinum]|uniref:Uncharacterized protein n=1 Tax=Clostridium botulinum TaxID=1491 RepID=A0A9Q1UXE8_CLOBO|nr:ORF6C domain-containing protein [Clostridium botulinum]AEB77407.1 hypothetical protein CbC4_4207 [Clostridium botulinum BKT015925]KEH96394.1 hypothetical protein Y848_14040 [Clostridium botulinum C/D str. Sp77]KEH96595.1 hypothetical protein Z953_p0179 [Clostridium botulinum D str. 16868]KLU74497.1 hypothetical protein CBC3_p0205 [Clostridium botulinum V891]KOA75506.1 hypothetical protein ADU78_07550 [Clostridium botulinum]
MENKQFNGQELQQMMGNLLMVSQNSMETTEVMKAELVSTKNTVRGLATQYNKITGEITNIQDRMDNLELNEEITDEQRNMINQKCRTRVNEVLDYNQDLIDKYYRTYISNLYSILKRNYGMGAKIATTKKRNYDTVMRGIQAWFPKHEKLRQRADRRLKTK